MKRPPKRKATDGKRTAHPEGAREEKWLLRQDERRD